VSKIKRGSGPPLPSYQGRHRVKRGFGSSCTAGIGSPRCSSAKWPSSLFARRSEHLRSTLALLPLARASWDSSPHLAAARSLTRFDAAGGQRKSLPPVCWVGSPPSASHPTSAVRLRWLAPLAQQHRARPLLKFRVRIHSAVVGQRSECSHAAAVSELDASELGGVVSYLG
jgi:hypothetical protein